MKLICILDYKADGKGDIFMENKKIENELLQPMIEEFIGNSVDLTQDYAEMALDHFFDVDLLKNVPLVGTVVKVWQGALTIKNLIMARNYYIFITNLKGDKVTTKRLNKHMKKLQENPKQLINELEMLLAYIERYKEEEKIQYMANIYRAYLRQSVDSLAGIDWEATTAFFEILERLLPQDIYDLEKIQTEGAVKEKFSNHAGLLRLSALGLLQYFNGKEDEYGYHKKGIAKSTIEGKKFYRIIKTGKSI